MEARGVLLAPGFLAHPKVEALEFFCNCRHIGTYLAGLWARTADSYPNGIIPRSQWSSLLSLVGWPGSPEEILRNMMACTLIELVGDDIVIHDWSKYAPVQATETEDVVDHPRVNDLHDIYNAAVEKSRKRFKPGMRKSSKLVPNNRAKVSKKLRTHPRIEQWSLLAEYLASRCWAGGAAGERSFVVDFSWFIDRGPSYFQAAVDWNDAGKPVDSARYNDNKKKTQAAAVTATDYDAVLEM